MPVSASRYARLLRRGLRPVERLSIIHKLRLQTPRVRWGQAARLHHHLRTQCAKFSNS